MNIGRFRVMACGLLAPAFLFGTPAAANAMNGQTAIEIDGGPLGQLALSGGFDGYGYYLSSTNNQGNLPYTDKSNGMYLANALIQLQKTRGVIEFNLEIGPNAGGTSLGAYGPSAASIDAYTTGPIHVAYLTIAPTGLPVKISAGQFSSVEGWESGIDWQNANQLTTELYYVQNGQNRGVSATYDRGPVFADVIFGDGYDTGVFNFLQAFVTYTFNPNNALSVYYGGNLGRTGLNAFAYGQSNVRSYGAQFINSQMIGVFDSFNVGADLNLTPEVQYQIAKADRRIGLMKSSSNFGVAAFADYSFGKSPYSLGAWAEYFTTHTSAENDPDAQTWFVGPDAAGIGFSVAPTWQYKYLFVRADGGYIYLLHNKDAESQTYGYGSSGDGRSLFMATLEAGVVF